ITDAMSPGTQKDALLSVAEWIRSTAVDDHIFKMTREERQKRIEELLSKCGYQKPKQKKLKLCS
ncbi:MAG: hypothetical protein FWD13_09350, partial [Treponema sp.]|nr:hypothetical protein [Treponema sp.]